MDWSRTVGTARGPDAEGRAVVVNVPTREALLQDLRLRLQRGEGFAVATLNLDHVVKLRGMPGFRDAYRRQTHVVADGNPVVWLSRLAGRRVELVPGADLVAPLAALAADEGVPLALVGSTEDTLAAAQAHLTTRHPGLIVAARLSPPFGFVPDGPEADRCLEALRGSGARLCLLALGAPKQEIFAAHARDRLPGLGFVSIGAGLDFLSGRQVRAPRLARRLALEWAWRLATDPRRLATRYAACAAILPRLALEAAAVRRAQGREG